MTFEQNSALPRRFVTSILPWLIGLGALLVYLGTMSHWATFSSVGIVAQTSGWVWQPDFNQPLAHVIYYPFRFLPEQLIPVALNSFNALLASLTLVLLARAVALMPHDRTSDQRDLENDPNGLFSGRSAWIPPVLAAAVLGLQISFWENATAVSSEILDVLVVAYVVRCLLEFRIDGQQSWMSKSVFVYALGITNNWALIGLSPFFLTALVWFKGVSFFNAGFIVRTILWGFAGLLLYTLLPLTYAFSSQIHISFSDGMMFTLRPQKQMIVAITGFLRDNYRYLVVGATSVFPLFFIGLRWKSSFGDTSPIGIFIAKAVFHIVHAVFFAICLLVVLSPPFSPRQLMPGVPFLNHTLLAALVVGYCSGYFLLVCGPSLRSRTRMNPVLKLFGYVGWSAVLVALVLLPVALVSRNVEAVQLNNTQLLDKFMALTTEGLPPEPRNIVSDNPIRLNLTRAYMAHEGMAKDTLFHDTQSAQWGDYHIAQRKIQGDRWPKLFTEYTNRIQIQPIGMIAFLGELVKEAPTFYLEPSFGYYFERNHLVPHGLTFEVLARSTNTLAAAPMGQTVVEANQRFWAKFDDQLLPLLKPLLNKQDAPRKPDWLAKIYQKLHLSDEVVPAAAILGFYCSRTANAWGVDLQKQGLWEEAAVAFQRAIDLSKDNVAAQINLAYNQAHQAGEPAPKDVATSVEDEFGKYNDWNQVMASCGPFDEPRFTFEQGRTFLQGGLRRQAFETVKRVTELEPTNYVANASLADMYALLGDSPKSIELINLIRSKPDAFGLDAKKLLNLDRAEATALLRSGKKEEARKLLSEAVQKPEVGGQFRAVAAQLYLQAGMHAEAVPLLESVVQQNPTDIRSMANLGFALLQLKNYDRAEEVLTQAAEQDPQNSVVRLNRAITRLRANKLDKAEEDYLTLQQQFPKAYQVQYGLAEIALARNDTAGAISHFEECVTLTPTGTPDYQMITNRLAEVRAQSK